MSAKITDITFYPAVACPGYMSAPNQQMEGNRDKIMAHPEAAIQQARDLKDRVEIIDEAEKLKNVQQVAQGEYPWPKKITQFADVPLEAYISLENPTPQKRAEIREFLRRVTHNDLKAFLISMIGAPELTAPERSALKNGDYDHSLFNNPLYPRLALREFIAGRMDRWELSDILIHHECMQLPGAEPKSLLDLTPEECALYGLEKSDELKKRIAEEVASGRLPRGRTYVYKLSLIPNGSILDRISELDHTYLINKQEKKHMVLPPYLLEKSLEVIGGNNIKPNPVLGESRSTNNQKKIDQRDLLVPCCGIFPGSTPKRADGYSATPIEFYQHDGLFHLYIESKISQTHRKAWVELADNIMYKHMRIVVLDREFPEYKAPQLSEELKFWTTLSGMNTHIIVDIALPHIFKNKERWKNEYHIDIDDFNKYESSLSENVGYIKYTIDLLKWKALEEQTWKRSLARKFTRLLKCFSSPKKPIDEA